VPLVILVADGARPDTLAAALDDGALPALAQLRAEGGLHELSTVFPSVTGPAYTPFLMGRHPAEVGLPALRWYDRTRQLRWPHARSYVGLEYKRIATDLDTGVPTLWEREPRHLGALPVIGRGLHPARELGRGPAFSLRAIATHLRGDVRGWLGIDRSVGEAFTARWVRERPQLALAAFTGCDKTSHAYGHDSEAAREALTIVDAAVARLRAAAERDGSWTDTQLWVVSDHGHEPVTAHEDLAQVLREAGQRTAAHPFEWPRDPQVAVMVSGNAMAHLYLDPADRMRRGWEALAPRWGALIEALVARPSVDLALLPHADPRTVTLLAARGRATVRTDGTRWWYTPEVGDPLGTGPLAALDADAAHTAMARSDYPDALVQITTLAASPRSGDVLLSAASGWDFRARWEPIPHVSSHGSLRRAHMAVPLLVNHPVGTVPRRTVDIGTTAAAYLGTPPPAGSIGIDWR
jgi:hypothetical protein